MCDMVVATHSVAHTVWDNLCQLALAVQSFPQTETVFRYKGVVLSRSNVSGGDPFDSLKI